jgi:hypothetical protein
MASTSGTLCKEDEVEILEVHYYEFLPVKINECTMDEEFLGDESLKRMSMEVDFQLH